MLSFHVLGTIFLSILLTIYSILEIKKYKSRYDALNKRHMDMLKRNDVLYKRNRYLEQFEKYKAIDDTQAETRRIIAEAKAKIDNMLADVNRKTNAANSEIQKANATAKKIIEDAHAKAQEIAHDAFSARDNAKLYQQTVTAMKNIILGYGSDYLIPSRSLLDDLAEAYGFSQASKDYKAVRSKIRNMVKNYQAALCDYADASRRQTAIHFIVDAFNGKAASILAKAKSDNFGTLRQKLTDAFTLVNFNGRAFRNARISDEYFQLRLEELRLACIIDEIRRQDIEEQRRIREQMREEAKARREIEKALNDAAKEEAMLQKAMEQVRTQLEKANSAQKLAYEAQIAELQQKYIEAEERNKRALSMAQQTKAGHVYIISNEGSFGPDIYKIGMTRRLDPEDRIRELSSASVPFPFQIHAMIWSDDAPALENMLHKKFALAQVNKVNFRKEFFRLSLDDIRSELEMSSLNVTWTIAAEASEFRESLAIEKIISEDSQAREDWLNHQLDLQQHRDLSADFDDEPDAPSENSDEK